MSRRILITGASVAGTTAAWWLDAYGVEVEVVERAPAFRDGGQNVDVRGSARDVLRRMGLEARAFERSTRELGTDWVDADDRVIARFKADASDSDSGPTADLEIRRGDLARMLYEASCERVAYRFGDSVCGVAQDQAGVEITFHSGRCARYDAVIVAEGVGSHTRELVFPGENVPRWMDLTLAYFSIPRQSHDSAYARQYNTVGGRGATLKPALDGKLGAYLGIQKKPGGENAWTPERQRRFIENQFANDGWEFPRILAAMRDVDDFYFDVLRQVHMPRWSAGRVVLTGDAAWCPTSLSGIGTTLALVGSYVLAGELAQAVSPMHACMRYERIMRPFVKEGQNIPKLVPRLLWPHSAAGLTLLRGAMRVAGMPIVRRLVTDGFARDSNKIALPDYRPIATL
ncbi:2-polyprenyl-6-methoxyphenol hydroxylase-like FAD-dependent oxidoreductase [Xanthomonas arboricola]|uniref:FAD-dependent monooxygenase n=1 Tax=Xanthomonas cannabis TaxID=1885674 RepID=UPI00161CE512|nr:FAD-dependent monooxygenase [Xanthomonas cannabis]MBB3800263.1 2-polyprenyl-6-methoxyphenol hydroxylase-like FAD-dependent oxidoreductase [Xanthomonas cannabis]